MDRVAIGTIRKATGIKGYAKVFSFSGEWDHWFKLKEIELRHQGSIKNFQIQDILQKGSDVLLKLEGIDTPEVMKAYHGWEIWVPKTQAAPLKEGEVYLADLIGLKVVFNNKEMGQVVGYREGSTADLLEILTPAETTSLVPFMDQYLGDVDFQQGIIHLRVDWILG